MDARWEGYFITVMFKQVPGSEAARLWVMEQGLYQICATQLRCLYRRSNAPANRGKMPIWIASLGYPVAKHESVMLDDVRINDALHLYVTTLYYRDWRFKGSMVHHFDKLMHLYVHGNRGLLRLHISPIETEERYVVGYGFKTMVNRASIGVDSLIVLPRTTREMWFERPGVSAAA